MFEDIEGNETYSQVSQSKKEVKKEAYHVYGVCNVKRRLGGLLTLATSTIFSVSTFLMTSSLALAKEHTENGEAPSSPFSFSALISSQAFATYISTFIIGAFAWLAIVAAKNRERKRNTFDMILASEKDETLAEAHKVIRDIHESQEKDFRQYAHRAQHECEESVAIRHFLNHYEYISVGLKQGVYDEETLFRAKKTIVIRAFDMCESYIKEGRSQTGVNTIYMEFEALVRRWREKPLKQKDGNKWKRNWMFWV